MAKIPTFEYQYALAQSYLADSLISMADEQMGYLDTAEAFDVGGFLIGTI